MFDWLPASSDLYWAIVCVALALLNVYQFAKTRDLAGTIKHLLDFGHAPEAKALVPAASIAHVIDEPRIVPAATTQSTIPPPWKGKS